MEKEEQGARFLTREVTRRQALRAGGIAALGLVFSKPLIETIRPKPAFAMYLGEEEEVEYEETPTPDQPAIKPSADLTDLEITDANTSSVVCTFKIINTSDDPPGLITIVNITATVAVVVGNSDYTDVITYSPTNPGDIVGDSNADVDCSVVFGEQLGATSLRVTVNVTVQGVDDVYQTIESIDIADPD